MFIDNQDLLKSLGINPREFAWHDVAACKGYTLNDFFDEYEKGGATARAVDELCISCPVQKECYEKGVESGSSGVWGGLYLSNGQVSKTKNSHKNRETMERIAEILVGEDE
jgi:hypothetical protein